MIVNKKEIILIIIITGILLSLLIRIIREEISIKMYFKILLNLIFLFFIFPIILTIHIIFNKKDFIENFIIKRIINKEPKLKQKLDLKSDKEKQRIYSKFSFLILRKIIKYNFTKFDLIINMYFSKIKEKYPNYNYNKYNKKDIIKINLYLKSKIDLALTSITNSIFNNDLTNILIKKI